MSALVMIRSRPLRRTPLAALLVVAACAGPRAMPPAAQAGLASDVSSADAVPSALDAGDAGAAIAVNEQEKRVVEAHATLEVSDLGGAITAVRELTQEMGGRVDDEEVYAGDHRALFVLRLPAGEVDNLFVTLARIGDVTERRIKATDVTRRWVDYGIQLDNLRKTLVRYQEILAAATKVEEMLAVEAQLARVKGDIERLQGAFNLLRDQVALSTLHLTIVSSAAGTAFTPRAKLYPGLRYSLLGLYPRDGVASHYHGPGLSLFFGRELHLDVDVLGDTERAPWHADVILVTAGGEVFSDFLGRGKRRFLNPYLGYRVGYGRIDAEDTFVASLSAGVELYRSTYVLVDVSGRAHLLVGDGPVGLGIEPTLGVHVAF